MCGRYTLLADELKIRHAFGIPHAIESYDPSYNIAPGQNVLAIIHDGQERRAGYLKWGLVPSWAKEEKIGYKMINARSETAHEKPSFKKLMARKRCLVIADSFYEWRKIDKLKQPERIEVFNERPFAFAGLWDQWKHGDKSLFTCTILTKESDAFMKPIHHRMPIILPQDKEDEWINPGLKDSFAAFQFIESVETERLTSYKVGDYVNKASNNDVLCIKSLS